jgi:prepilin-type N-terminal cleavage/methylation domain-containing protein
MKGGNNTRGLTLIEVMIVIAIMVSLFAVGVLMSMAAFHNSSRRSERDALVTMFERARSRSMANVNQNKWGVCFNGTSYVLFGGSYPSTLPTNSIDANTGVTLDSANAPNFACASGGIMFDQLSGKPTAVTPIVIKVTQGADISTITINAEGRIDW